MISLSRIRLEDIKEGNSFIVDHSIKEKISHETHSAQQEIIEEDSSLTEAEIEAQNIINKAQEEAARIIEDATIKAQELFNQTHEEGLKSGYNAGFETGKLQIQTDFIHQIKGLETITKSSFAVKKEIITSAEQELIKLSITIAEKLVKQKLEIQPDIILNIVKAAINELKDKEEIKIIVNPCVTSCLYEFSDLLKQEIQGLERIKIIEDKTIPLEGVIVESLESRIDARLDSQINEISKRLLKEASENPILIEIPKEIDIMIEEPENFKD
jgi:flagellar assembly protein FliH